MDLALETAVTLSADPRASPDLVCLEGDDDVVIAPQLGLNDLRDPSLLIHCDVDVSLDGGTTWIERFVHCTWKLGEQLDDDGLPVDPAPPTLTIPRIAARWFNADTKTTDSVDLSKALFRTSIRSSKDVVCDLRVSTKKRETPQVLEPLPPPHSIALDQATSFARTSSGTSIGVSFGALPGVGEIVVAGGSVVHTATPPPGISCSDNQGNTYNIPTNGDQTIGRARSTMFIADVATSSGTFTVTIDSGGSSTDLGILCWNLSGEDSATPEDVGFETANDANGDSGVCSIAANGMFLSFITCQGTAAISEEGGAWVFDGGMESPDTHCASYVHKPITGGITDDQHTWTHTTRNHAAVIIAITEAAAGAAATMSTWWRQASTPPDPRGGVLAY